MNIINEYLNKIKEEDDSDDDMKAKPAKIGVDLDGTLAFYNGWEGHDKIGKPIPKMMARVKKWISQGKTVVIFTARAHGGERYKAPIRQWVKDNGLPDLEITNVKTPDMKEIWDDRAIQVKVNTGEPIL